MIEIVSAFLLISLCLYIIFAGADFGAGILELFAPRDKKSELRELVTKAIGPVWEANHIWLILFIVILFSAFPSAYSQISTYFHFPLLIVLLGVVLRGCSFTFRHYDTADNRYQELYSFIFSASSFFTPLAQGILAGGLILGDVYPEDRNFFSLYVKPWFNLFSLSVGIFLCFICSLVASVFLYCEKDVGSLKEYFKASALLHSLTVFLSGLAVFVTAEIGGFPLFRTFLSTRPAFLVLILAGIALITLNIFIRRGFKDGSRAAVAALVVLILSGWCFLQYPYLMGTAAGGTHALNIYEIAAPPAVLTQLLIALAVGSILIFPAIFLLIRTFKYR